MPMVEIPPRATPDGDDGYLEEMTKAIFRSGFSWQVVRNKWDAFRNAFHHFDVGKVAGYGGEDITRLLADEGIVRNRRKILATIGNARAVLTLSADHSSFNAYLRSLDHVDYYQRVKELSGRFNGLGRTGTFVFLYCVNEETPDWTER